MIHIFVNALAASAGGGLTYVRNIVPHLAARKDVRATFLLSQDLRRELQASTNIEFVDCSVRSGVVARYHFEQTGLARLIRSTRADVLLSAGNFALRKSPIPQILLSRNALYTSVDFSKDLLQRREYGLWLDTRVKGWLAKRSIRVAEITVAPSQAFRDELCYWTGKDVKAIHHGFDGESFAADATPLSQEIRQKLESCNQGIRLLFVSHYNYYRNFETLIRAIGRAVRKMGPDAVHLILTCALKGETNPGPYRTEGAARLVDQLGVRANIIELGSVSYKQLHHVYRACDVYVTPAYCESFAHPLVEAMFCGLPIVASDLPVHQEICQESAIYFPRFSDVDLCEAILQISASRDRRIELGLAGRRRVSDFSWRRHVDHIVALSSELMTRVQ